MNISDLAVGERVRFGFGYGLFEWEGVVVAVDKTQGNRAARNYHTVTVESDSGRRFTLRSSVWYAPETRWQPSEFSIDEYSIETDNGEKARLTMLKRLE